MKKIWLIALMLAVPALSQSKSENKPLPQDAQIKLLKGQRQLQQLQAQMADMQRQYKEAVKQAHDLQVQMNDDCGVAAKASNVDLTKYTCDMDSLTFAPRPEPKPAEPKTAEAVKPLAQK